MHSIFFLSMPSGIEWLWLIIVLPIYFLPAIVSFNRKHHNLNGIIILNTFLGWTFLGWIGALIWSFSNGKNNNGNLINNYSINTQHATKRCPFCAEDIKIEAKKCKLCNEILH